MTSRRDGPRPVLDRFLTRAVDVPAPAGDLVLRLERATYNRTASVGEWVRDSGTEIQVSITDLDNKGIAELVIESGLAVTLPSGGHDSGHWCNRRWRNL